MTMSIDVLERKNKEITRLKVFVFGWVAICVILVSVVVFLAVVSQLQPPNPSAGIKVLERYPCNDDGDKFCVPNVITAGVPFDYQVRGNKLIADGASVSQQIVCLTKTGSENIVNYNTFYSNLSNGEFDIKRSATIPTNSRIDSADDCYITSIASYQLYQGTNGGNQIPINVEEVVKSNHFKLIVPPSKDQSAAQNKMKGMS